MHDTQIWTFDVSNDLDRDLFRESVLIGLENPAGYYVGDLLYDAALEEAFFEAAHARTLDNNKRKGNSESHLAASQIAGGGTTDTVGLLGECPLRLALPNDICSELVVQGGTDRRPDLVLEGKRVDVKAASRDKRSTFSVVADKYDAGEFDAMLLVKPIRPGQVRVFGCAAKPNVWNRKPGVWRAGRKQPDYYLLVMPDPAPTTGRRFQHMKQLEELAKG